jgi:hypothetical protein
MRATAALVTFLSIAAQAGAQCLGDFNGNGSVEVNEVIVSVNNLLNGCTGGLPTPTVTPTPLAGSCPIDFSDDNTGAGTPDCYYTGRWNQTCGMADLETRWVSDGQFVVVELLGFPGDGLFYGASVKSANSGDLIGWFTKLDASDLTSAPGALMLGDHGGSLDLAPNDVPFQIDNCDFAHYAGALTNVVQPGAAQRAARAPVGTAALQRLRALRDARAAKPDLRRR